MYLLVIPVLCILYYFLNHLHLCSPIVGNVVSLNILVYWQGTVVLVFQPAEEGGGGAKKMLDEGTIAKVKAIFGIHIRPDLPLGEVSSRPGPILAGSGFFEAVISGKGGHAAIPQQSIDPILAASNVIVSLQHLVSREADPLDSQVYLVSSPPSDPMCCDCACVACCKPINATDDQNMHHVLLCLRYQDVYFCKPFFL